MVPILAGLSGRGVRPLTWASALGAFAGMALLEGSGAPPSPGDAFSFLSACSFGVQVLLFFLPHVFIFPFFYLRSSLAPQCLASSPPAPPACRRLFLRALVFALVQRQGFSALVSALPALHPSQSVVMWSQRAA